MRVLFSTTAGAGHFGPRLHRYQATLDALADLPVRVLMLATEIAQLPDISECRPILEQLAEERAVSPS